MFVRFLTESAREEKVFQARGAVINDHKAFEFRWDAGEVACHIERGVSQWV